MPTQLMATSGMCARALFPWIMRWRSLCRHALASTALGVAVRRVLDLVPRSAWIGG